ncbi:MAG: hypothetical protein GXO48_05685 [Chlorobi bacterium]|nr:hypothetical protein [Chlorobiota bacterium]
MRRLRLIIAATALLGIMPEILQAQDRFFAYSYSSPNIPMGGVDIEPWITYYWNSSGTKRIYYQRLEVEYGITNWVQSSFYFNYKQKFINGVVKTSTSFSHALKFSLSNPSIRLVGFAFYFEYYLGSTFTELETRIILDKWWGNNKLVVNLIPEIEWVYTGSPITGEVTTSKKEEFRIEYDYTHIVRLKKPLLSIGLEGVMSYEKRECQNSFVCPSLLCATTGPRAGAFITSTIGYDLITRSAYQLRFILGVTF